MNNAIELLRLLYRNARRGPFEQHTTEGSVNTDLCNEPCCFPRHIFQKLKDTQSIQVLRMFDWDAQRKELMAYFLEVDLTSSTEHHYEALSYTWNNPIHTSETGTMDQSVQHPGTNLLICKVPAWLSNSERERHHQDGIVVNGLEITSIPLQANLADFLESLAARYERQHANLHFEIWIDAICIDQQHVPEKQAQIARTGAIYANARRVHVWLGKSIRHWEAFKWVHGPPLSMLKDLIIEKENRRHLSQYSPLHQIFWNELCPRLRPPTGSWLTCWESYCQFLMERTWFRRAWTYQEILLGKTVFFYVGASLDEISSESVHDLLTSLEVLGWRPILFRDFGIGSKYMVYHSTCEIIRLKQLQLRV